MGALNRAYAAARRKRDVHICVMCVCHVCVSAGPEWPERSAGHESQQVFGVIPLIMMKLMRLGSQRAHGLSGCWAQVDISSGAEER